MRIKVYAKLVFWHKLDFGGVFGPLFLGLDGSWSGLGDLVLCIL